MATQLSFRPFWDPPVPQSGKAPDSGPPIAAHRGVRFFDLPCRTVLNRCDSQRMPFEWTINPYRGCEFGCTYCYARYSHEYLGFDRWLDFEEKILVKREAARRLEAELLRLPAGRRSIALGTVTDPYQPAEREFRITRQILERLAGTSGLRISITTKSGLITRDLDLLLAIARRNRLTVNVTIVTLNRRFARRLEPRAPTPEKRLATIQALARAGIRVGLFVMPVLPGLTDAPGALEALVRRAKEAGARHLVAQALFLRGAARRGFLPRLNRDFPALTARYRREYGRSVHPDPRYREALARRIDALRQKYGLGTREAGTSAGRVGSWSGAARSTPAGPNPGTPGGLFPAPQSPGGRHAEGARPSPVPGAGSGKSGERGHPGGPGAPLSGMTGPRRDRGDSDEEPGGRPAKGAWPLRSGTPRR